MFYEYRQYQVQPGRRDEWVRYMEDTIIPYQRSRGMDVIGSFVDEQQPDLYIWMRRFESEEQRQQLYAATYDTDEWQHRIKPVIDTLLLREQIKVTRIVPTEGSGLR